MTYVVWHHYFNSLPTVHPCMRHSWWFTQLCPISWHPSFGVDGKSRCNGDFNNNLLMSTLDSLTLRCWIQGYHLIPWNPRHYSARVNIHPWLTLLYITHDTTIYILNHTMNLSFQYRVFNVKIRSLSHHEIQLVWLCVNTYQTILQKMNIINPSHRTSVITQGIPWCFDP